MESLPLGTICLGLALFVVLWFAARVEHHKEQEEIKAMPPAPCGNDKEHYYWTEREGWPCPVCMGIENRNRKLAEEERKARFLAKCIAAEIRNGR